MLKIIKISAVFLAIALNWSCTKGPFCNCFSPVGSPSERTLNLPSFDQITVKDNINVFLSTGPQEQVTIQGGSNLIKYISADVSSGMLTLKNENKCNWMRSYKKSVINVYITMPNITYIKNEGIGKVKSQDTLVADSLQLETQSAGDIDLIVHSQYIIGHLFGPGDLTLSGTTGTFLCNFFAGTGFAYCDKLNSGYTFFSSSTTGDCYVTSSGALDVVIYRNGNIYYSGKPTSVSAKTYSKGQLIPE